MDLPHSKIVIFIFSYHIKIFVLFHFIAVGGTDFKTIPVQERDWQFHVSFREMKPQPSTEIRNIISIYQPDSPYRDFGNPGVWTMNGYVSVFFYYAFVTNDRNEDLCPAFKQQIKTGQLITVKVRVDNTGVTVELNGVQCLLPMSKFDNRITERMAYQNLLVKACSEVVIEDLDFKNLWKWFDDIFLNFETWILGF